MRMLYGASIDKHHVIHEADIKIIMHSEMQNLPWIHRCKIILLL